MTRNLFSILGKLPATPLAEELVEILAQGESTRIERIISTGHASPAGFWYDQEDSEWVLLLSGEAGLLLEGDEQAIRLRPGDFIHIPARRKHRIEWTSSESPTLWLAVFYRAEATRSADAPEVPAL